MNKRDHRGWRIPHEGNVSRKIYDLAVQDDLKVGEIAKALGLNPRNVSVLLFCMKHPDQSNVHRVQQQAEYRRKHPDKPRKKQVKHYSNYVRKLMDCMGVSLTEARRLEREMNNGSTS